MPDFELVTVDGARGPVLVVDRFDRDEHKRIGYISAMTLLEAADGDEHRTPRSPKRWSRSPRPLNVT